MNRKIINRVVETCYSPALRIIEDLLVQHEGAFKLSFSISGVAIEQLSTWHPEIIERLKRLAETGQVEFLGETYYHSLSFNYSRSEFLRQIRMHSDKIADLFGHAPQVFRNTELIYQNHLAFLVSQQNFQGILTEGVEQHLHGRTPNVLFHPPHMQHFPVLLRNYGCSDDIAFRFSDSSWEHFPLTAEGFAQQMTVQAGDCVCLGMDFESFGEHQKKESGIFDFLRNLPAALLQQKQRFLLPSEVFAGFKPVHEWDVPEPISWADREKDLSAWMGNLRQQEALRKVYEMEATVKELGDAALIQKWSYLQNSDHFYYMSDKKGTDGEVHQHFSPFDSPEDAYAHFMNLLADFQLELRGR